jgi:hypothetical protein
MKKSESQWTFINKNNPKESIVVHDTHSFESLSRILSSLGGWMVKSETAVLPPAFKPPVSAPADPPPTAQQGLEPRESFSGKDRRAQRRFETEFRVVLITGAHSFRNTTEDVSMGGMKLKRPVPLAFLSQKCTIFISHPALRENVQISCKVLADPKDPRRVQFTDADKKQLMRLEEWLAESTLKQETVA